jgi:hypothetical protein
VSNWRKAVTAVLIGYSSAGLAKGDITCAYRTGQTATLETTAPHQERLILRSRNRAADISLIRLNARGEMADIETNGGVAKQQEVARVSQVLITRARKHLRHGNCGIPWNLSPE